MVCVSRTPWFMSARGAQRQHVTLPTGFCSPSENSHSRYGYLTASFAPKKSFETARSNGEVGWIAEVRCAGGRLFNDLIGAGEQRRRYRDAKRLRGIQVNDQLEAGGLLDRKIARLSALQNLVHHFGGLSTLAGQTGPVGHQPSSDHVLAKRIDNWKPVFDFSR